MESLFVALVYFKYDLATAKVDSFASSARGHIFRQRISNRLTFADSFNNAAFAERA